MLAVVGALTVAVLAVLGATAVPQLVDADDTAVDAADLITADREVEGVEVFEDLPTTHTEDDVTYAAAPSPGGPHFPRWLACGEWSEPVPEEVATHDLEHGTFWFTYDPEALDEADLDVLREALPDDGILSPYPGLRAPVVLTVWARQLELASVEDPGLEAFVTAYGDEHTAPEPLASCEGGLRPDDLEALGLDGAPGGIAA